MAESYRAYPGSKVDTSIYAKEDLGTVTSAGS
jgi:hypothetical protein